MSEGVASRVARFGQNEQNFDLWAKGNETTSVDFGSGPVKSPKRLIKEKEDEINTAADGLLAVSTANVAESKAHADSAAQNAQVAQSAQTKGLIGFANVAEMNADLFWPDRTVCELADSGDHYRKSGASGSGSWIKGGTLLSASAFAQLKSGRSKFSWAVRGTNNKVAIWINKAGQFCIGATENVLGVVQTNQTGLSGLQTSYNGVISTKSRSKFAWAVRGTNNKVAIWLNKAGQFCIGSMENVQGVIQAVQTSLSGVATSQAAAYKIKASRSVYAIILGLDTAGRVALGLSKAGRMIYRGVDIHALLDLATFNATQKLLFPNRTIYAEGDSLLEGAGATGGQTVGVLLAARFAAAGKPRTVVTIGFGGSSSANILARTNIVPALITFPNGANGFPELPAAGSVNVTVTSNPLNYPGDPAQAKSRACSVAGIAGTLTRASGSSGGQYSWARTAAGTAMRVEAAAPITFDLAGRNYGTGFCFIGTNDVLAGTPAATILGYIDSYVAGQPTVDKRCPIVMPLFDNANANVASRQAIYAELLSKVQTKYPGLVVDTLRLLQAANNGSANDLADVAAGLVPRSLSSVSDPAGVRTHLNSAGYDVIAAGIQAILDSKGW